MRYYAKRVGITTDVHSFCTHSLRATTATNALANGADIAKVQEWLGHANGLHHAPLRQALHPPRRQPNL